MNVVIDRFGKDVNLERADEEHFNVRVNVAVSSTFLAWVFQFGHKVKVLEPGNVVERYREMLMGHLGKYK